MKVFLFVSALFAIGYVALYWCASKELREHISWQFVFGFMAPVTVGFLYPNVMIFFAIIFLSFVFTVRSRADIVCRVILLSLLLPNVSWDVFIAGSFIATLSTIKVLTLAALTVTFLPRAGD